MVLRSILTGVEGVPLLAADGLDRRHGVHPGDNLAEHGVAIVEPRCRRKDDEEFAPAGAILLGNHGNEARAIVPDTGVALLCDRVADPRASAVGGRHAAALGHEAWDDTVEVATIVRSQSREAHDVRRVTRSDVGEQAHRDRSQVRLDLPERVELRVEARHGRGGPAGQLVLTERTIAVERGRDQQHGEKRGDEDAANGVPGHGRQWYDIPFLGGRDISKKGCPSCLPLLDARCLRDFLRLSDERFEHERVLRIAHLEGLHVLLLGHPRRAPITVERVAPPADVDRIERLIVPSLGLEV